MNTACPYQLCCVQQSERPRTFADWTIALTSFSIVQSANVRGRSPCWTQHWFRAVAVTNCSSSTLKFLSSKGAQLPENKLNQNFLQICYLHSMSFITITFHEILWSCTDKKKPGLTEDWLTDGSNTLCPPQIVTWGIINQTFRRRIVYCYVCYWWNIAMFVCDPIAYY